MVAPNLVERVRKRQIRSALAIIETMEMPQEYIERRGDGYYFIGSRVSLDSVVYQFLRGETPEGMVQAFPSLSLVQVFARRKSAPLCKAPCGQTSHAGLRGMARFSVDI
jgi:hypothetical protein